MPLPYSIGSSGPEIEYWHAWFTRQYPSYAPAVDGVYGEEDAAAVREMQTRLGLPPTGVFDADTASHTRYVSPVPGMKPIMFTVEGHCSDMFKGPAAATAAQLEAEGVCHHQPVGYNNAAIPFDNASGVQELAKLVGSPFMPNMVPFPAGTPWALSVYSQGGIVGSDFYFDFLAPGKPLAWRTPDLRGVLSYANPCRQTGSIAQWACSWIDRTDTHGLDPARRFGLPGFPAQPECWVEVYRKDDIFAENGDDTSSQMKAAVYQAVARGEFFDPCSLAAKLSRMFDQPVETVFGIVRAIMKGIVFLHEKGEPHYSYAACHTIGGLNWMRERLTRDASQPQPVPPPPATTIKSIPAGTPSTVLAARVVAAATAPDGLVSGLTEDEQRELLDLARQIAKYPRDSRSPLRHLDEHGVDTIAGLEWSTDANIHVLLIERLAVKYGDPQAIQRLQEIASADTGKYPERRADAELAQRILAKVDATQIPAGLAGPLYLQRGAKGPMVRVLQARLNRDYPAYSDLEVDGEFEAETEGVVKEFQRRSGLAIDGTVGPTILTLLKLPDSANDTSWAALIAEVADGVDSASAEVSTAASTPAASIPGTRPDDYARIIIDEGRRRGVTPEGIKIALATALVESGLVMYANERDPESLKFPYQKLSKDYDSVGLFQQRPQWWGTVADRMDPRRSAGMFYAALAKFNYQSDEYEPGWYAQQVQRSAIPDAYQKRYREACKLYESLAGANSAVIV